ncbi:sodium/potassium-transporting ATPase subunit beta-2-like [Maniola jurtina]|uniref:sodium/potassium-transporting ATPase subunit beta-2-like n=1 Tax=Maniola jurtina TaxID=191418 RepID=UPI001E68D5C7|nr:sodium/potassium-transporting ATPase subunit beta-2-like [Maniola jurtina]
MILVGFLVMLAVSRWQIDAKAVDTSPGLDFVPRPDPSDADNTLIYYKSRDDASVLKWTSKIDEFFAPYKKGAENIMACSADAPVRENLFCDVDLRAFEPCISENKYNYDTYRRTQPCVFLKLDKLLNWIPNPYNTTDDMPSEMPDGLQQHIDNVSGSTDANTVWVSCEGENPADVEFIGPIKYLPTRGFPTYFFPYKNQEGYLSPLVAVQFLRPTMGIVINIKCTAWAKNIDREGSGRRGSVHFELMID